MIIKNFLKRTSILLFSLILVSTSFVSAEEHLGNFLIRGKYKIQKLILPSKDYRVSDKLIREVEKSEEWGSYVKNLVYNENVMYMNWIIKNYDYGSIPILDVNVLGEMVEYDTVTNKVVGVKPEYRKKQNTSDDKKYKEIINSFTPQGRNDLEKVNSVVNYVTRLNIPYNNKVNAIINSGQSLTTLPQDQGNYLGIVKYGMTTCTGYTQLASDLLDKTGVNYRFVTVWVTDKPEEPKDDLLGHIYIQVRINGSWRDLDFTRNTPFRDVIAHPILKGIHIYSWGLKSNKVSMEFEPEIFFYR